MITNLILAVVVGVLVTLVLYLISIVIIAVGGGFALLAAFGAFCGQFGGLVGFLAAVWWYFTRTAPTKL